MPLCIPVAVAVAVAIATALAASHERLDAACKSDQGQTVDILWPQLSDKYTSCHKNSLWLLITASA